MKTHDNEQNGRKRLVIQHSVYYACAPAQGDTLLLALHGYGQTCERFLHVLQPLKAEGITVLAPQAPNAFYIKMPTRTVGFTWLTRFERDQAVQDFFAYMDQVVAVASQERAVPFRRIFLLGFSQGVSMAWRYALSGHVQPAGLIACGADLPPDVQPILKETSPFPVLLAHGNSDSIVPAQKTHEAEQVLRNSGFQPEKFLFPGGHEIPVSLLQYIADWMRRSGEQG